MVDVKVSPEKRTVIIIDGASLDRFRSSLNIDISYVKLHKFVTEFNETAEIHYFNSNNKDSNFLEFFEKMGYIVDTSAETKHEVGVVIAEFLKTVEAQFDNFIIVGAAITGYGETTQEIVKKPNKNVIAYSFKDLVCKTFIGNHVQFIDIDNHRDEMGISAIRTENNSIKKIPPVTVVEKTQVKNIKPGIQDKKNLIIIDGSWLKKFAITQNIEIDFNKLKKFFSSEFIVFDIKYFDLSILATDKVFIKKLEKIGYQVDTSSTKKTNLEFLIQTELAKAISKYDSITIIGELDQNYLHPLLDKETGLAKKTTHLYSDKNFICKPESQSSMKFHQINNYIDNIKVIQTVIIFIDGENFNIGLKKRGIQIDFENLLKLLVGNRVLFEARYYMRMPLNVKKTKLKNHLEGFGYKVITGPPNGNDTDPTMISDIQRISQTNVANNYILVAGDNSYADPLSVPCIANSWLCEIFALPETLSADYKTIPGFIHLNPEDFLKSITLNEALNQVIDVEEEFAEPVLKGLSNLLGDNSADKKENQAIEIIQKKEEDVNRDNTEEKKILEKTKVPNDALALLNLVNRTIQNGKLQNLDVTMIENGYKIHLEIKPQENNS